MMTAARVFARATVGALALLGFAATCAQSHEQPLTLKWSQLLAKGAPAAKRPLLGSPPIGDLSGQAAIPEGKWMSMKLRQPGSDAPPAVVPELEGQTITIGGYLVPLDFENSAITEFLLVPYVGACVHVPPPAANQVIYVKAAQAFAANGGYGRVTVTGTMHTKLASTGLADAGYSLDADKVEARTQ